MTGATILVPNDTTVRRIPATLADALRENAALQDERDALREALKPFAAMWAGAEVRIRQYVPASLRTADIKRAHDVLAPGGPPAEKKP